MYLNYDFYVDDLQRNTLPFSDQDYAIHQFGKPLTSMLCLFCNTCRCPPPMCLPLPIHGAHDDKVHADTNHYGHHHSKCNQPHLNSWLCLRSQCGTQAFKLQCVICQPKNPIDATSGMPTQKGGGVGGGGL